MTPPILVTLSATHITAETGPTCKQLFRRAIAPGALKAVADTTAKYSATNQADLLLGQELFEWLDGQEKWLTAVLQANPPELCLELWVPPDTGGAVAFLEAPWELLAGDISFLADTKGLSFSIVRRYAVATARPPIDEYRPSVVFMASDPVSNSIRLDYEAEESAILRAIGVSDVDFLCEDSGNLQILSDRVNAETEGDVRVDIVHLSCHGTVKPKPVLLMETELGDPEAVGAHEIDKAFQIRPRLLCVAACETAEADKLLGSLAGDLARRGFPAVLGWAGKVQDRAATRFAAELYKNLANQLPLERAVAEARQALKNADDEEPHVKGEWHKARLYFGSTGGGKISAGKRRRHWHDANRADSEFLDKRGQVKVASRWQFVGRRRPIQAVLRNLRGNEDDDTPPTPTVVHGLGQHGKSSLAARIASRFPALDTVVVFGDYTPKAILQTIRTTINRQAVSNIIDRYIGQVNTSPDAFRLALGDLLRGPLRQLEMTPGGAVQRAILLIVDDFEQALEPVPGQLHRVVEVNKAGEKVAPGMAVLFQEFARAEGQSRLLITSRFKFTCVEGGQDAAERLAFFQLPDMLPGDLQRQARNLAVERVEEVRKKAVFPLTPEQMKKREKAMIADLDGMTELVCGSPRLMSFAANLVADAKAFAAFKAAATEYKEKGTTTSRAAVAEYMDKGTNQKQSLVTILSRIAVDGLLGLLDADERELLRRSCLFQIPVPADVAELLHPKYEADAESARNQALRLFALGLWNRFENPINHKVPPDHALIDPLVRPKVDPEAAGP